MDFPVCWGHRLQVDSLVRSVDLVRGLPWPRDGGGRDCAADGSLDMETLLLRMYWTFSRIKLRLGGFGSGRKRFGQGYFCCVLFNYEYITYKKMGTLLLMTP